MNKLKAFLLSSALLCSAFQAYSCIGERVERWYMFCTNHADKSFLDEYDTEVDRFWRTYANINEDDWYNNDDLLKAAAKKGDVKMQLYLNTLKQYTDVVDDMMGDSWDYPTAQELSSRKATLTKVANTSRAQRATATTTNDLKQRWTLLEMRANMVLHNYAANIKLWETAASRFSPSVYREKMRNIYANALLNTGQKEKAWDIYADQNDVGSLQWSIRKYTNLAGIKTLAKQYPNAPALSYLLQCYVNNIQEVYDGIADNGHRVKTPLESDYDVYAQLGDDWNGEIKDFIAFATEMGNNTATADRCMWLTAAALSSYYRGEYTKASQLIDSAMEVAADSPSQDLARRCRMLIACSINDVNSLQFKKFIAGELNWLDQYIIDHPNSKCAVNARDRILNLGLADSYDRAGDNKTAIALSVLHEVLIDDGYLELNNDHRTSGFGELFELPANEIESYFNMLKHPGDDPVLTYLAKHLKYSDDYVNDIIGTRYISMQQYKRAIPYLEKVSQNYLNRQSIAPYVARRDYHKPAWNGWQKLGDIPWEPVVVNLKGNVKLNFCREVANLMDTYATADKATRASTALKLAQYLYQASPVGQCWFITDYSATSYPDESQTKHPLAEKARTLLNEVLTLTDNPTEHTLALYGLVGSAPDSWYEEGWDDNFNMVRTIKRNSVQYRMLEILNTYLRNNPGVAPSYVGKCDVLKQFRRI